MSEKAQPRPNEVITDHNSKRGGKVIDVSAGYPKPVYYQPRPQEFPDGKELMLDAAAQPYQGIKDPETGDYYFDDPQLQGMNNLQAAHHRLMTSAADGNLSSINAVLDRLYGKPKQSVEAVQVKMTYQNFLDALAPNSQHSQHPQTNSPGEVVIDIQGMDFGLGENDPDSFESEDPYPTYPDIEDL